MRKLLPFICLALSACSTPPPETPLPLKEVKFPDLEFSRFIAENGIRRTEQNDSSWLNLNITRNYDSLGKLIKIASSTDPTIYVIRRYDTNGLVTESIEASRDVQRWRANFQRIRKNIVSEDNYAPVATPYNKSGTTLLHKRTVYLLDEQNRVIKSAQYFPYIKNPQINCLHIEQFKYDTGGKIAFVQHWEAALPLLPLRLSDGATYQDTRYYYTGRKPDSTVKNRLFTSQSFGRPFGVKEVSYYDQRGLIKETIMDDTVIIGYQHSTN